MVYWLHFWMLNAKNVKTIAARIKMTVKAAPERDGPRNIKNKLVHLIHSVVPSLPTPLRAWAYIIMRRIDRDGPTRSASATPADGASLTGGER
jgi:hypothetical protein